MQSVWGTGWKAGATKFLAVWRIIRAKASRKGVKGGAAGLAKILLTRN
jgi:hypothetical protein